LFTLKLSETLSVVPKKLVPYTVPIFPQRYHPLPYANGVHTGEPGVPVLTMKKQVVELNINKQVAGKKWHAAVQFSSGE
jgi:hypothetical protein